MIFRAIAPSNIAFLKYWGKQDAARQWPANDSLSMTLDTLATTTDAEILPAKDHRFELNDEAFDRSHKKFKRSFEHLDYLSERFGYHEKLSLHSSNTFPTGAGIASSASGFAALTIAALAAWNNAASLDELEAKGFNREWLAHLSRMGSGSAGRSLFGGFVEWQAGHEPDAQQLTQVHSSDHWRLNDSVVIFSDSEKLTSSKEAHQDAWSSPLFRPRLAGLSERMHAMKKALANRLLNDLGPLLETEALEMHAVMLTSKMPQNYLSQEALDFLVTFRKARLNGEIAAYFTIDAGPNIHIIHERAEHKRLLDWLQKLGLRCLHDQVGQGVRLETPSIGHKRDR